MNYADLILTPTSKAMVVPVYQGTANISLIPLSASMIVADHFGVSNLNFTPTSKAMVVAAYRGSADLNFTPTSSILAGDLYESNVALTFTPQSSATVTDLVIEYNSRCPACSLGYPITWTFTIPEMTGGTCCSYFSGTFNLVYTNYDDGCWWWGEVLYNSCSYGYPQWIMHFYEDYWYLIAEGEGSFSLQYICSSADFACGGTSVVFDLLHSTCSDAPSTVTVTAVI